MLQLADLKSRIAALSSQFETLWGASLTSLPCPHVSLK